MSTESSDPSVSCVYCGEELPWSRSQREIVDHHSEEHPEKRYSPDFYPTPESSDPSDKPDRETTVENPHLSDELKEKYRNLSEGSDDCPRSNHTAEECPEDWKPVQPSDPSDRIDAGNREKFSVRGHAVTVNEWHAVLIAAATGVVTGLLWIMGRETEALGVGGILLGYSILGKPFLRSLPHVDPEYPKTMALRTIRYEPWWFTTVYVVALAAMIHLA